jgi:disulfide bond formation protein DsbB
MIPLNRLFLFCCFFAGFALLVSYWAELAGNFQLCPLCKWQRLILGVVFLVSGFGIGLENKKWPAIFLLWLLVSLLLVAGYHLLVQGGVVVDRCAKPQNVQTLDEFRLMLQTSTPCAVPWSLMSIPVSVYNVAFALLGIIMLKDHFR